MFAFPLVVSPVTMGTVKEAAGEDASGPDHCPHIDPHTPVMHILLESHRLTRGPTQELRPHHPAGPNPPPEWPTQN